MKTAQKASTRPHALASVMLIGGLCLGSFSTSCLLRNRGPSTVAQGMHYSSGNPGYDPFFDTLYQVQLKMASVPQDEQSIRRQLAHAVGADDKIDPGPLGQAVDGHTDRMAKGGVGVTLTVSGLDAKDGPPSSKLETTGGQASESDRHIIAAIDTAAQSEAKLIGDMRQTKVVIARLRDDATTLEPGVDTVFKKEARSKRAEVKKNIQDAEALIPLMVQRADEVEGIAKETLDQLAHVANTAEKVKPAEGAETAPKIVLEEDKPDNKSTKHKPAPARPPATGAPPNAAKPASAAAAAPAPPPPPPPPPPKDDFQP